MINVTDTTNKLRPIFLAVNAEDMTSQVLHPKECLVAAGDAAHLALAEMLLPDMTLSVTSLAIAGITVGVGTVVDVGQLTRV